MARVWRKKHNKLKRKFLVSKTGRLKMMYGIERKIQTTLLQSQLKLVWMKAASNDGGQA